MDYEKRIEELSQEKETLEIEKRANHATIKELQVDYEALSDENESLRNKGNAAQIKLNEILEKQGSDGE